MFTLVADGAPPITINIGKGLAGACAQAKELVNVPDAYKDDRFSPAGAPALPHTRTRTRARAHTHAHTRAHVLADRCTLHPAPCTLHPAPCTLT